MYYILLLILLFFSVVEILTGKRNRLWFKVAYMLMTFMVMFRYGQLTDYSSYELIYYSPEKGKVSEPLYIVMTESFNSLGFSYEGFVIILGILGMGLAYPFFSKLCKGSMAALLIFYCYAFLILPMSAIRQGICLCILLCSFSLLLEKKKKLFYIIACFGSLFHYSMIAVVLIGFLYDKKIFNNWYIPWILLGLTVFALVTPDLSGYLQLIIGDKNLGEYQDSRLMQMVLRASIIFPLVLFKPPYGTLGYYGKSVCIIGYCMYCILSFGSLVSGRLEYYFRIFLCLFVASCLFDKKCFVKDKLLIGFVVMVHVVLFFKNIDSFIQQSDYDQSKVNMFNFPYVSIFDKEELERIK